MNEIMNEDKTSDVEVYVHNKLVVSFCCPLCKLEKTIGVERIKDVYHWNVKAKCRRCGHDFKVSFNFRKYYRKETYLHGLLFSSSDAQNQVADVIITDLSLTGLGFECKNGEFEAGNVFVIRFILDDEESSKVEKQISIQSVRGHKVGADFMETKGFDKALGKYILPK